MDGSGDWPVFYGFDVVFKECFAPMAIRLHFSGCKKAFLNPCPHCHNDELWDFRLPQNAAIFRDYRKKLHLWKMSGLEIGELIYQGGEPLDQSISVLKYLYNLTKRYFPQIKFIVFTGYECFESLPSTFLKMENDIDYIKLGSYQESFPKKENSKLASGNQRLYKLNKNCLSESIGHELKREEIFF